MAKTELLLFTKLSESSTNSPYCFGFYVVVAGCTFAYSKPSSIPIVAILIRSRGMNLRSIGAINATTKHPFLCITPTCSAIAAIAIEIAIDYV